MSGVLGYAFSAYPWMIFLALSWGAQAQLEQATSAWNKGFWALTAGIAMVAAVSGIINPALIRWHG